MPESSSDARTMLCCRTSDDLEDDGHDHDDGPSAVGDVLDVHDHDEDRPGSGGRRVLTDLDIKEWNILLRENDVIMEEQNIQTKENLIRKSSEDNARYIREALEDLERREAIVNQEMKRLEGEKRLLLQFLDKAKTKERTYILKVRVTEEKGLVLSIENYTSSKRVLRVKDAI